LWRMPSLRPVGRWGQPALRDNGRLAIRVVGSRILPRRALRKYRVYRTQSLMHVHYFSSAARSSAFQLSGILHLAGWHRGFVSTSRAYACPVPLPTRGVRAPPRSCCPPRTFLPLWTASTTRPSYPDLARQTLYHRSDRSARVCCTGAAGVTPTHGAMGDPSGPLDTHWPPHIAAVGAPWGPTPRCVTACDPILAFVPVSAAATTLLLRSP